MNPFSSSRGYRRTAPDYADLDDEPPSYNHGNVSDNTSQSRSNASTMRLLQTNAELQDDAENDLGTYTQSQYGNDDHDYQESSMYVQSTAETERIRSPENPQKQTSLH